MKIQLKRSNVLDGGAAKQPTAGQMEYGELAVNYNNEDPAIFIKDSNDNIVRIAGAGYDYDDLDNLPTIGDGTITINNADGSENATFTVNQVGDTTVTLPAGFSGDYDDLTNQPTIGDAEITIEQNSVTLGTFTVNQTGDATITLPDAATIYPPSTDEPGTPSNGDIWIDSNECPPVLKIWSDCDGTGEWYDLTASTPKPIEPSPGDGNNTIDPMPPGSGTEVDPYVLTAKVVNYGGSVVTDETITFSNQKVGALVQFVDQNTADNGTRYTQPVGVVGADGTWSGKLSFVDSPATTDDTDYTGLLKIGTSSIYYSWAVRSETAVIPPPVITQNPVISSATEETDTAITVDTRAGVTNATFTSSAWKKDGVELAGITSTTSYTPTEAGTYQFCETFTGNDSSTVYANSNSLVIEEAYDPTKPNATMSGLRFDDARDTVLTRGAVTGTKGADFSLSVWAKQPSDATSTKNSFVINAWDDSSNAGSLIRVRDQFVDVYPTNYVGGLERFNVTFTENQWNHFFFKCESNTIEAYVNGSSVGTDDFTGHSFCSAAGLIIGADGKSVPDNKASGYLSDVYFVEQVLEPTVFGKSFEGKWGPLDSSVVLENIKAVDTPVAPESPYESRPNMEQKWSDTFTTAQGWFSGDYNNLKAFDGSTTTYATLTSAGTAAKDPITFSPSGGISNITSIEIKGKGNFSFDGVEKKDTGNAEEVFTITDVASFNTMTINHISGENGVGSQVFYIKINGKFLVDGSDVGPFNTVSETWEQYARTTLGYALDRIAKLEQMRLADAATIEDLRTKVTGALSRIASIESDEVNDDAVDNALITLVGSVSAQVNAFTARIEAAETAIAEAAGRITTLES